ncbi:hypothetical protein HISP_17435 [Haloarcula hispanica N601]|uniref:Uncharacterized protein n=1 Tax=Haloarcula hispanica N601 TaxID=1417673 RepID=V5TT43_HALHI|nr:hypothetical protein HISP_17435 [Haloarcula hispanica N601]
MAVVLGDFWGLQIRDHLDESVSISPRLLLTGRCIRVLVFPKACFYFFYPLVFLVKLVL